MVRPREVAAMTTTYAPGMPAWVDLASPEPERAARFYQDLFGWTGQVAEEPEAGGTPHSARTGRRWPRSAG